MGNVRVDYAALKKFRDNLAKLSKQQTAEFTEAAVKELAAQLLAKVKKVTPVGNYSGDPYTCVDGKGGQAHNGHKAEGKTGGTLRRNWTIGNVIRDGDSYSVEVINPTEYAPYVEYGHRTGKSGWVNGHLMLTISAQELKADAPRILENKLKKFLEGVFNAK